MSVQSLNCPNCGAAASTESTRCEHCNSRLAAIACPACFGMMFVGAKFCSHCGAKADRKEILSKMIRSCPRCRVNTKAIVIGKTDLRECPRCEGIWADAEALQTICADREQQSAVLGVATPIQTPQSVPVEKIKYLPCPTCRQLMHRVNFARCSNVVVDICKPHGTRTSCAGLSNSFSSVVLPRRGRMRLPNWNANGGNWRPRERPPLVSVARIMNYQHTLHARMLSRWRQRRLSVHSSIESSLH